MATLPRLDPNNPADRYPSFAHPGGYPIYYVTRDNSALCPACANRENGSEASPSHEESMWRLVACDVHYEGAPIDCEHCGATVESAYGEPDSEANNEEDEAGDDIPCVHCDGTGGIGDVERIVCDRCDGGGYLPRNQDTNVHN